MYFEAAERFILWRAPVSRHCGCESWTELRSGPGLGGALGRCRRGDGLWGAGTTSSYHGENEKRLRVPGDHCLNRSGTPLPSHLPDLHSVADVCGSGTVDDMNSRRSLLGLVGAGLLLCGLTAAALTSADSIQRREIIEADETDRASGSGALSLSDELGCESESVLASCMRARLLADLDAGGSQVALSTLDTWSDWEYAEPFPCHAVAHFLGREITQRYGSGSVGQYIREGGVESCNDGLVHGMLEGVGLSTSPELALEESLKICDLLDLRSASYTWCIHGSGHAVAMASQGSLTRALQYCLSVEEQIQSACTGGVMMTYGGRTIAFDDTQESLDLATGEVIFSAPRSETDTVCETIPLGARPGCYEYLWMHYTDDRPSLSSYAALCGRLTDAALLDLCSVGMGDILSNATWAPTSFPDLVALCQANSAVERGCTRGLISSDIEFYISSGQVDSYVSSCTELNGASAVLCTSVEDEVLRRN